MGDARLRRSDTSHILSIVGSSGAIIVMQSYRAGMQRCVGKLWCAHTCNVNECDLWIGTIVNGLCGVMQKT